MTWDWTELERLWWIGALAAAALTIAGLARVIRSRLRRRAEDREPMVDADARLAAFFPPDDETRTAPLMSATTPHWLDELYGRLQLRRASDPDAPPVLLPTFANDRALTAAVGILRRRAH